MTGVSAAPLPAATKREQRAAGSLVWSMAALLVAQLVGNLNANVVTTALPTIVSNLGGTTVAYTWMMTATILGLTVSTPIWSRLADLRSPKALMQIAIGVFLVGALAAGLAPTATALIVARGVQGVGIGGMIALVQIILAHLVSPRHRGGFIAWLSAVQLAATLGGPFVGGVIVEAPGLGWRYVFLVTIPFAVLAMIGIHFTVRIHVPRTSGRVDLVGAALLSVGVGLALVWLSQAGSGYGWSDWETYALLVPAAIALVSAVVVELRVDTPIVPLRALRSRTSFLSLIAALGVGSTIFGGSIFLTQYLQYGRGVSPSQSGLMLTAMAVGSVISSFAVGRYVTRTGRIKAPLVAGCVAVTVAMTMLATITPDTPVAVLVLLLLLEGLGMGATMQFLVLAVQNDASLADVGAITGAITFVRSLGGTVALAAFGALLDARLAAFEAAGTTGADAYLAAVPIVFAVSAAVTVPGLVAAALLPRLRMRDTIDLPPAID